ncbi:hypothetical protein [Paenibacillus sp. YYML68]|uniref:hypothetical protein n=1 Tax=Paenibacillus sp. YYML68 TaxID=2909250 RepID=UPI0024907AD8|nr:hypothetical protein [Paenibacillus sp. YYML68]
MYNLTINCRTCEFFANGRCTNPRSEVGYNQMIQSMDVEGKGCWSISLDYFSLLVSCLPLKDQKWVHIDESLTVIELLERVETGEWGYTVRRRMQRQSKSSSQDGLPASMVDCLYI